MSFRPLSGMERAHARGWWSSYQADTRKNKISKGAVTLSNPRRVTIRDERAYVVIPAKFDFKVKGKPSTADDLIFTIVLLKEAAGWRTTGWAWALR